MQRQIDGRLQEPAYQSIPEPGSGQAGESSRVAKSAAEPASHFLVGDSPQMREVFEQIRRFASCDVPVLVTGESGTGKELVARAIHERSRRLEKSYVALNCAALPASLIASELFGYEKGAFTGAAARKLGYVEHADGGTLFLDEIGDMPIDLQGVMLRFLQEGEILRVGGRKPIKVDVRVIAATNVRPREAITTGKLREDLYYRLNVLTLHLPPLREREGDVELLAMYFLREIGRELGRETRDFTPAALRAIRSHDWPGNVRELIATIRRAVVLANGPLIDVHNLGLETGQARIYLLAPPPPPQAPRHGPARPKLGSDAERISVVHALQNNQFNLTRAAQALGVSRATIYRKMQRHRIELRSHCQVQAADPIDTAGCG